jgi:hypothetical protein
VRVYERGEGEREFDLAGCRRTVKRRWTDAACVWVLCGRGARKGVPDREEDLASRDEKLMGVGGVTVCEF